MPSQGMILLVPVCLLLAITTSALTSFSAVLSMAVAASQRQATHTQLLDTGWQQLKIVQQALRASPDWQQTLTAQQRSLIQQHQAIPIRGAHLDLFALDGNFSVNNGQWRSAARLRAALLRFPALLALPPAALVSTTSLPAGLQLTVLGSPVGGAELWLNVTPHSAALLRRCQSDGSAPCSPATASPHPFPVSLLNYLFGIERIELLAKQLNLTAPASNCRTLAAIQHQVVVVRGDCHLSAGQQLGTAQQPVLLVVIDGHISMASGARVVGVVLTVLERSALPRDVTMAANAQITGALITMQPLSAHSVLRINYAPGALQTLQRHPDLQQVTLVPGSWHDF